MDCRRPDVSLPLPLRRGWPVLYLVSPCHLWHVFTKWCWIGVIGVVGAATLAVVEWWRRTGAASLGVPAVLQRCVSLHVVWPCVSRLLSVGGMCDDACWYVPHEHQARVFWTTEGCQWPPLPLTAAQVGSASWSASMQVNRKMPQMSM